MSDNVEPKYFPAVKNALLEFGRERNIAGWVHVAKHIPGKLYKAQILFDDIRSDIAEKICLTYAEIRQELIDSGTKNDKAGDEALALLTNKLDDILDEYIANPKKEEINQVSQDNKPVSEIYEWELTTFIAGGYADGAFVSKETGLTYTASLQSRGNDPYTLADMIFTLDEIAKTMLASGKFDVNYKVLGKEYKEALESEGSPPSRHYAPDVDSFPDNNLPPSQMKSAQPKNIPANGNKMYEITGIELTESSTGKIGYKFYHAFTDQNGKPQQKSIQPGNAAEYLTNRAEPVLKALGFSADAISEMGIGDKKQVKPENRKVTAEVTQEPNPNKPGQTFTKIVAYHLSDGTVIK